MDARIENGKTTIELNILKDLKDYTSADFTKLTTEVFEVLAENVIAEAKEKEKNVETEVVVKITHTCGKPVVVKTSIWLYTELIFSEEKEVT